MNRRGLQIQGLSLDGTWEHLADMPASAWREAREYAKRYARSRRGETRILDWTINLRHASESRCVGHYGPES